MMRSLKLLLVVLLALTTSCSRCDTAQLTDEDLKQLAATRAELARAMTAGDVAALERIYADDYGLVNRYGRLRSLTERLEMLESGRLKYLELGDESELRIDTYGKVAVVRGVIGTARTELDGVRREKGPRRFTAVWVHDDGEWRQVSRQHTTIGPASP